MTSHRTVSWLAPIPKPLLFHYKATIPPQARILDYLHQRTTGTHQPAAYSTDVALEEKKEGARRTREARAREARTRRTREEGAGSGAAGGAGTAFGEAPEGARGGEAQDPAATTAKIPAIATITPKLGHDGTPSDAAASTDSDSSTSIPSYSETPACVSMVTEAIEWRVSIPALRLCADTAG